MRYDNRFWILIAPTFARCACFAFEKSGNFAESWNSRFEELRRGFEMLGGKAKSKDIRLSLQQVPATNYADWSLVVQTEAQPLVDIRAWLLFRMRRQRSKEDLQ
jgi:hypothetical protein